MDRLRAGDPEWVGPYRLLGRLGGGGMGQVFLGLSRGGRQVAVKVVRPELADDARFRERFAAEIAAARKVGGFFTAQVVDADPDADPPWLVTAYVPGPSLEQAVHEHGPLPGETVSVLGAGLAEGLAAIHRCGLVHRDLKPGNVILAEDGPRVIDFGIARALDATHHTASITGTPPFMSPEQTRGQEIGPASDVFSFASVLVYAATGRTPFGEGPTDAIIYRIRHDPPDLSGLPPHLTGLVTDCLAKDPESRPSVDDVIDHLAGPHISSRWLPPAVTTAVAERRAEADALLHPSRGSTDETGRWGAHDRGQRGAASGAGNPGTDLGHAETIGPSAFDGREASRAAPGPATPQDPGRAGPAGPAGPGAPVRRSRLRASVLPASVLLAAVVVAATTAFVLTQRHGGTTPGPAPTPAQRRGGSGGHAPAPVSGGGSTPTWHLLKVVDLNTTNALGTVAFSPDGKTIAAGAPDDDKIWLFGDTIAARTLSGPSGVSSVAFSPDGRTLAAGGHDDKVWLWDVTSGAPTGHALTGHTDTVYSVAFRPDGRTLASGSADKTIRLWNTAPGAPLGHPLTGHTDSVYSVAFSPDGRTLASGGRDTLRLWNTATQAPIGQAITGGTYSVAFSPDGKTIASDGDADDVRLWDAATGNPVGHPFTGHTDTVFSVAFSPDGRTLAAGGDDQEVRLWNTADGAPIGQPLGYSDDIMAIAFSPDGRTLASGGRDGKVQLWGLS
ncbi:serine/threonine protein kinase [Actinoallomurus spadix]|uniref:WD40 repeat domain-containing serine/threonine protein kinase n=1 Tax=Actinoallomurus spadix TaxID=79912 RepID=UPI0020929947|nr:serine/threonine-protein kinase [Actinoallomurus spadix]MCO5989254.1 serine/threonine protein kinase [Actinoallomurus spadix]